MSPLRAAEPRAPAATTSRRTCKGESRQCVRLPACLASARRTSPCLPPRLFSEPFVEHGAREADVPADPMTGQAAGPHGLVDPARPDVEIPSGLIRAKEPVLLQRSLCCWGCCFHADIDPNAAEPANGFLRRTLGRLTTWRASRADGDAPKPAPATAGRPLGNDAGNDALPSQPRDRLAFAAFAGVLEVGPAGLEPATYRL